MRNPQIYVSGKSPMTGDRWLVTDAMTGAMAMPCHRYGVLFEWQFDTVNMYTHAADRDGCVCRGIIEIDVNVRMLCQRFTENTWFNSY